ncbi:MAG: hypothetical protein AB7P02_23895 [Alphaproteobacteria bacterium]
MAASAWAYLLLRKSNERASDDHDRVAPREAIARHWLERFPPG